MTVPEEQAIQRRYELLAPHLDERGRRLLAAVEAMTLPRGGVSLVSRLTGVSRQTITSGVHEMKGGETLSEGRVRRPGGGRKRAVEKNPDLWRDLESLVEPTAQGDPESPLRWTCKSVRKLRDELGKMGHRVGRMTVQRLLKENGYSLQANRKTRGGGNHPDRNAQFEHINETVKEFIANCQPVISVDAKKKELVGDFKNGGREYRPKGQPAEVRVHDFPIPELGKVTPYGVYDLADNAAWVSVGTDRDTAQFAVETIRRWWYNMGCETYPEADRLLITADGGGSNGSRVRLWKSELQKLATETNLEITVCHFPPGTSKWNKIEHRLFSCISQNWRGRPLLNHEVIVNLIGSTATRTGLRVQCALDRGSYPVGLKIPDEEFSQLSLIRDGFHGEWNYVVCPD